MAGLRVMKALARANPAQSPTIGVGARGPQGPIDPAAAARRWRAAASAGPVHYINRHAGPGPSPASPYARLRAPRHPDAPALARGDRTDGRRAAGEFRARFRSAADRLCRRDRRLGLAQRGAAPAFSRATAARTGSRRVAARL